MDVGVDRISKLPDPLVHHILSFLQTKCAVSTSVLSKRWRNVWVSVPVLDFRSWEHKYVAFDEEGNTLKTNNFMDFVDRVLVLRNMLNIKKFCLNCEYEYFDHKRVYSWISTVMKCEVEELILSVYLSYTRKEKMIPDSLFTCESLTALDFQFPDIGLLSLPESISLPSLKILRLTNIEFDDENLAGKLFSNCPLLEELCLTECRFEDFSFLCVLAPRLKSFTVMGYKYRLYGNVENIKVKIDAPNLTSFTSIDWLPEDLVVDSFPLLQDADLHYQDLHYYSGDIGSRVGPISKFIMKLYNVKLLKISGTYFQILRLAKALSTSFPTFHNLICLEVYDIRYLQMNILLKFLEFSPNLESLIINQVIYSGKANENTMTFNKVPHCLVCLKSIEIRKFSWDPMELKIVKFVLKHARVLQMVILESSHTEEALNNKIRMQLGMSPWASADCVIKFSSS